jgi:hypothetical protein
MTALRELARSALLLAAVLAVAAGVLSLVDRVPAWLNGEDRDVQLVGSLEEAERHVRARLVLPAYFPETITWPPERIRVLHGDPPSVSLVFADRATGAQRLVLTQVFGRAAVPERLLPSAGAIDESRVAVGRIPARLRRIVGPDGAVWRELEWEQEGRTVVARSSGSVDELVRMARSARVQP